jgi:ABC-type branched-subunit amino acid transport system substrate-binding protein
VNEFAGKILHPLVTITCLLTPYDATARQSGSPVLLTSFAYSLYHRVSCLYILQTAAEYKIQYDKRRGSAYSKFHGYAYDGIWVIAKAIDTIIKQNGGDYTMDDFRSERIQSALNETNFVGVTVSMTFPLIDPDARISTPNRPYIKSS